MQHIIDTLHAVKDTVINQDMVKSWAHHLARNPERMDSMFQWLLVNMIWWIVLFKYRNTFLKGLAGDGRHVGDSGPDNLDAREIVIFLFLVISPACATNVSFFHKIETWQIIAMWALLAPLYYQIFGRFIFDWLLAYKSGASKVTETIDPPPVVTTTTTTEVK